MFSKTLVTSLLASTAFGWSILPRNAEPIEEVKRTTTWTPKQGDKWQITLANPPDMTKTFVPTDITMIDLDLFDTPASTITTLKAKGIHVLCYFSAGTLEPGRPDTSTIASSAIGSKVSGWPQEKWLNIKDPSVVSVMKNRIALAAQKGCDGVDPDNMDAYNNGGGGFSPSLTQQDTINFLTTLSQTAAANGLRIGLKNADEVLDRVTPLIQFAVNEQCVSVGDCSMYKNFLAAGHPVFHIEYPDKAITGSKLTKNCAANFNTVNKKDALDGWVEYCDGSVVTTPLIS